MSNQSVDQRTVELTFDNAEFEAKVAQSLLTLSDLREATRLKDAGKGFESLAKSAQQLNFSDMAKSVEELNQRFSAFGIVGMSIIHRLTNAAMDFAGALTRAITAAPRDGWSEFELNTDSIKTILNSAKDADGLPVTLEKVNEKLNELNTYSDKTIYSFSDMTSNIGKFTNAGVDLDSAVTAIQGVANVAALAGANSAQASRAMYNFGQALGSGSVKLLDWMSIENASMATTQFKEELMKTALEVGTLKKVGEKYVATTKNQTSTTKKNADATKNAFTATENFRDSLSDAWMTSEVLTKTLAKYTDEETELGRRAIDAATEVTTLSKLFDTLKESMGSGWMQTWQFIIGDFNQAKSLWTGVYREFDSIISRVAGFRNGILKAWSEAGGRDDLIEAVKNLWATIKAYTKPIKDAFTAMFPNVNADGLIALTKGFKNFTERIKPAIEKVEEIEKGIEDVQERADLFNETVKEIIRGDWGNGQERIDRLHEAGYAFENLQNAVNETLGCAKRYETTMSDNEAVGIKAVEVTDEHAAAMNDAAAAIDALIQKEGKTRNLMDNLTLVMLGVTSSIKVVKTAAQRFFEYLGGPGSSAITIFVDFAKAIADIFGTIGRQVYLINTYILSFSTFGELFEAIKDKVDEFFKGFEEGGLSLNGTRTLLERIQKVIVTIRNKISDAVKAIKDVPNTKKVNAFFTVLKNIGKFVGGALLTAIEYISRAINSAYDAFKRVRDAISEFSIVQRISSYFGTLIDRIKEFWSSFKTPEGNADTFNRFITAFVSLLDKMAEILTPVFSELFDKFVEGLEKVNTFLENQLTAFENGGVLETAVDVLDKFKGAVADIPATIDSIGSWFAMPVTQRKGTIFEALPERMAEFLSTLDGLREGLATDASGKFAEFTKNLSDGIRNIANIKDIGKFSEGVNIVADSVDDVNKIQQVPVFLKTFAEGISKIDFKAGALIALLGSMALFVFRWSKVGKNLAVTIKAVGTFITTGGKVATLAMDKYTGFLRIGAAIALIAGAIWTVAQIPVEDFKRSVATLAAAFGIMLGVIIALTVFKVPADTMKGIGAAFVGMAASMLLIAAAIQIFTKIDLTTALQSAGKMIIFMGLLAIAARIAGSSGIGAGVAFLAMSIALMLLVPTIKMMASMDTAALIKGGAAIVIFMGFMAGAAALAGKSNAFASFFAISLALALLVPTMAIISMMSYEAILKSGSVILSFMLAMSLAAFAAKNASAKPFVAMAFAVGVIAASLVYLARLSWPKLLAASLSLKLVLNALVQAMLELSDIEITDWGGVGKSLLAMLGIIAIVVAAMAAMNYLFKDTSSGKTLALAASLSLLLIAIRLLAPAIDILSKIDFKAGVVAAGNLLVFFGALTLALGVLGELAAWGLGDELLAGAELLGKGIGVFIHGIISAFAPAEEAKEKVTTVEPIGEKLTSFAEKIQGFIDMVQAMPDGLAEKAKTLAEAILVFTAAELVDAIAGWITGKTDVSSFAEAVDALIGTVVSISTELAGKEINTENLDTVITATKKLVELAESIPETGGLVQKITGVHDLSAFGTEIEQFISGETGMKGFIAAINGLGDKIDASFIERVEQIKTIADMFVEISKSIPAKGGLKQAIEGAPDLGDFADQMKTFIRGGYRWFAATLKQLGDPNEGLLTKLRDEVIPVTEEMINLGSKIKMNSAIVEFFIGKNDLGEFGTSLAGLGTGLKEFGDSTKDVSAFKINFLIDSTERFADLNNSENIKVNNLSIFGSHIEALGRSLKYFRDKTEDVSFDALEAAGISLEKFSASLVKIGAADYSGTSNFATSISQLAEIGIGDFISQFYRQTDTVATAVGSFVDVVTTTISSGVEKFTTAAETDINAYSGSFTNKAAISKAIGNGEVLGENTKKGIENKDDAFKTAGNTSAEKYATGIDEKKGDAQAKAKVMAENAKNKVGEYTDDFYDLGKYGAQGYANGFRDYSYLASNAVSDLVNDAYTAGMNAQLSKSPSKKYKEMALFAVMGYALGFRQNARMVTDAVDSTVQSGLEVVDRAIDSARRLIDEGMDVTPTIAPVIDLNGVSNGIQQANAMINGIDSSGLAASAAISIANQHNAALAQAQNESRINYSRDLNSLIENTSKLITAVKQNRYAIIDGDSAFDFIDRRMGMA